MKTYEVFRQKGSDSINIIEFRDGKVTHVANLSFATAVAVGFKLHSELEAIKDEEAARIESGEQGE